jgi:hypothetical protein
MFMLWTIPAFLAVWSVVGVDLYNQGAFEEQKADEVSQVIKVDQMPQLAELRLFEVDR